METQPKLRDHTTYQRVWLDEKFNELLTRRVRLIQNILWSISIADHEFPKPDIPHTV